jgi:hypothetical protein
MTKSIKDEAQWAEARAWVAAHNVTPGQLREDREAAQRERMERDWVMVTPRGPLVHRVSGLSMQAHDAYIGGEMSLKHL